MTEEEYVLGIIEAIRHNERRKTIEEVVEVVGRVDVDVARYLENYFLKAEK